MFHTSSRRSFLRTLGASLVGAPLALGARPRQAHAGTGRASRVIFFYYPDGVAGPSQDGAPSLWHPTGSEHAFTLSRQLDPLASHQASCLFFRGLSLGPTDAGSHPGGAKKLLTATDGGWGESIDQRLARTVGADAPFRHVYLGAMANQNNASGDKHVSYPSPGQSVAPEDDPLRAFERLFGAGAPTSPVSGGAPAIDPKVTVIDGVLAELHALRTRLGRTEQRKLELHLEALRQVEARIKAAPVMDAGAGCHTPRAPSLAAGAIASSDAFPDVLRLQIDLMVEVMACGLTKVGTLQASHHTSELIMSRFAGTELHDPGFDMRSHQASHYGASHDLSRRELAAYVAQRRWWSAQLAYLLDRLRERPEGDGTMLDHSLVLFCTEVCDGNTHLHDDMPFVLAGGGGGAVRTGRLLDLGYERHASLLAAIAHAMGDPLAAFGDPGSGPLTRILA
ncbi:DUF1552 domain-containing protein [Myxococcota bacterium]|nr:DUF1552 domain-containing protein [Myxococcota bacterium]